jgi:DNA-binding NarL/FixJ family response regulator
MAEGKSRSSKAGCSRVLIIDDQPLLRRGLAALINSKPDLAVAGQVGSRAAALEMLAKGAPNLVTVDLVLQGGDGLELIKDIEARFPELPVLVISMHDESVYAERAFRAGARGFVTKQEPDDVVVTAIRQVLKGEKYISSKMVSWFANKYLEGRARKDGTAFSALSDRELEVFRLLGEHKTRKEISRRLNLSVKTVETYRAKIKEKLGLTSGTELVERASRWVATGRD